MSETQTLKLNHTPRPLLPHHLQVLGVAGRPFANIRKQRVAQQLAKRTCSIKHRFIPQRTRQASCPGHARLYAFTGEQWCSDAQDSAPQLPLQTAQKFPSVSLSGGDGVEGGGGGEVGEGWAESSRGCGNLIVRPPIETMTPQKITKLQNRPHAGLLEASTPLLDWDNVCSMWHVYNFTRLLS